MAEEYSAEGVLVVRYYEELRDLDGDHELLRYFVEKEPDWLVFVSEYMGNAFERRFPPFNPAPLPGAKPYRHPIFTLMGYRIALEKAIAELKSGPVGHAEVEEEFRSWGLNWPTLGEPINCQSKETMQPSVRLAVAKILAESIKTIIAPNKKKRIPLKGKKLSISRTEGEMAIVFEGGPVIFSAWCFDGEISLENPASLQLVKSPQTAEVIAHVKALAKRKIHMEQAKVDI